MKLMVNILEHEQASCVVDFLLYAYMNPENDVHKAIHHFHGKGLFLILKQVFVTFVSPSVNPYIEGTLVDRLTFFPPPIPCLLPSY